MTRKPASLYMRRMAAVFITYTIMVVGINLADSTFALPQWARISMSLLPVIPAITMIFVVLAFFRTMDEVWQRIISESAIISAGIVGIGTFTYGFLQGATALPDISLIWVWPALIAFQGLAMIPIRWKYQ